MTVRADSNSKFLRRYLLFAAIAIGFILWCFYDALVTYPKKLKIAEAYFELTQVQMTDQQRIERWREIAKENGWPTIKPEEGPAHVQGRIVWQYVMAGIAFAGLLVSVRRRQRPE